MTERLSRARLSQMIAGGAAQIREHHSMLSELDSAAGDGDHGASMLRIVERLEKAFAADSSSTAKSCFHDAGWAVLGTDGGASSSLLGIFFLGMSDGIPEYASVFDLDQLAVAFRSGLCAVREQSSAKLGDKTMMDSLIPAIDAFSAAAQARKGIEVCLESAALAAQAGAEETRNLIARHGRGRFLGEKARGYLDPGATSVAFLFEGFYRGLLESKGETGNA